MKHTFFAAFLKCIFLLLIAFPGSTLQAQAPAKFPDDPKDFVDQLGLFMTTSKRPDLEETYAVFKKMYRAGAFREDEIKRIVLVSNVLGTQNLSAYPYYKNYFNAVIAAKTDADTTLFSRWHTFAETVLSGIDRGRTKPISQFL